MTPDVKIIEQSDKERIGWALEEGIIERGNADDLYRVVETGYLGDALAVSGYLAGLKHGKAIEREKYPSWEHQNENWYETESRREE